jgi:hypothetical protein
MTDYQVDYHWDDTHSIPILTIAVSGRLLTDKRSIPAIIDQGHTYVEQNKECKAVYLIYDFSKTEGRFPLDALMRSTPYSHKIKEVAIIGAHARTDEMALLIMGAAKRIPYEYRFFHSFNAARDYFYGQSNNQEH